MIYFCFQMVPGFLKLFDEHIKQTLIKNYRECTDYLTDPAIELMNDVLICKGMFSNGL